MEAPHLGSLLLLNTRDERDDTGVVGGSLPAAMLPTGPAYGEEDDEAEPTLLTVRKSEKTTECVAAPSSEHQAEAGGRQDSPQQNDFKQEEDVEDPQLLNQESNLILVQVERVPLQIKEEQKELCISREGEQFGLKQETETFNEDSPQQNDFKQEEDVEDPQLLNQERNLILVKVERVPSQIKEEQEELCISQEGEQFGLKQETERFNEDLPQQHECKQVEVLADQQLWNQERNNHLDQKEPEPLQVKEQQDEVSTNQEGVPLVQKQEPDTFMVTSTYEENEHREAEPNGAPRQHDCNEEKALIVQERNSSLDQEKPDPTWIKEEEEEPCSSQEEERFGLKQETDTFMVTPTDVDSKKRETEPMSEQLLSHSSPDTKSKYQGADSPQQNDLKQEEDVEDPQLLNQERNLILVQVERLPSQIKEEQEELCISQEGEQFGLKQETERFNEDAPQHHDLKEDKVLIVQERNSSLDKEKLDPTGIKEEELCSSQEETHFGLTQETGTFMVTPTNVDVKNRETEPMSELLLSRSFPDTESKDQGEGCYLSVEQIPCTAICILAK
ncbi:uncharacterized protein KZ484_008863 [Pholidichthys leucotaenia]